MATRRASSSAASSVVNGETSIANETMPLGDAATNDDDDDHVEGWAGELLSARLLRRTQID